jgi:hypothetical protein
LHISAFFAVGGFVGRLSVRLNAGESHELQFPLKDIIYTSPTTVRLSALVKQGYAHAFPRSLRQASTPAGGNSPVCGSQVPRPFGERIFYGTAVKQRKKAKAGSPKAVRIG